MPNEKRLTCNICDEEWEASFFCAVCERDGEWMGSWDGLGEGWRPVGNVCGNCCICSYPTPKTTLSEEK